MALPPARSPQLCSSSGCSVAGLQDRRPAARRPGSTAPAQLPPAARQHVAPGTQAAQQIPLTSGSTALGPRHTATPGQQLRNHPGRAAEVLARQHWPTCRAESSPAHQGQGNGPGRKAVDEQPHQGRHAGCLRQLAAAAHSAQGCQARQVGPAPAPSWACCAWCCTPRGWWGSTAASPPQSWASCPTRASNSTSISPSSRYTPVLPQGL